MTARVYTHGGLDTAPVDVERLSERIAGLECVHCFDGTGHIDLDLTLGEFSTVGNVDIPTGYSINNVSVHPDQGVASITLAPMEGSA